MINKDLGHPGKSGETDRRNEVDERIVGNLIYQTMMAAAQTHPRAERSKIATVITSDDFDESNGWLMEVQHAPGESIGLFSIFVEKDQDGASLWDEYHLNLQGDGIISRERQRIDDDDCRIMNQEPNIPIDAKLNLLILLRESLEGKANNGIGR